MDFEKVKSLLDEGKIDDVKNVLNEFRPQFEKTVGDLKLYEGKFNEAVQTRDKAKGKLKEISGVFGIDSDELTTDKLKELIKTAKADDASKAEIAKLGAGNDVVNDRALKLIIESLKDGATIDNGEIVYRDSSGVTLRNGSGQPLSISEKMAQFKADASNSFLFKPTTQGGGGSHNGGNGGSGSQNRSKMTHAEKGKFIKEHGEEAYLKLPK